jgi:hypothetical protein
MEFSRAPTVIGPTGRVNAQPDDRLREAIHSPQPSFRDGAPAPDLRCAIAHRGISRFRVRCFASPRNDSAGFLRRPFPREPSYSPTGNADSDTPSRSRRAFRASFARTFRPLKQRAWGMPGARCTRSLVCAIGSKYAHEYSQRATGNHPTFPHAMVYGLFRALPGDRLSCHRRYAD